MTNYFLFGERCVLLLCLAGLGTAGFAGAAEEAGFGTSSMKSAIRTFTFSPTEGSGHGGTIVTLTGHGFEPGCQVYFGQRPATEVAIFGSEAIICRTPPGGFDAERVYVGWPDGVWITPVNLFFTYHDTVGLPEVRSIEPAVGHTGGGTIVRLEGFGLNFAQKVAFDNVYATEWVLYPDYHTGWDRLECKAPPHPAGTVDVMGYLSEGEAGVILGQFTYVDTPDPRVFSISPAQGPFDGGTTVTITGSGFVQAGQTQVRFGSMYAEDVTVNSSYSMTCTTPAQTEGVVSVTVTNPNGQGVTKADAFRFLGIPGPRPLTIEPASGPANTRTFVVIRGTGLCTIRGDQEVFPVNAFLQQFPTVRVGGQVCTESSMYFEEGSHLHSILCWLPPRPGGVVDIEVEVDGVIGVLHDAFTYVGGPAPQFSADVRGGDLPLSVQFTDLTDYGSVPVDSWLWDFGDGETSEEQNPVHIYQDAGLYPVTLTVTTAMGTETLSKPRFIDAGHMLPALTMAGQAMLALLVGCACLVYCANRGRKADGRR